MQINHSMFPVYILFVSALCIHLKPESAHHNAATTCTVYYRQHLVCFYIYLMETFQVCYTKYKVASPYHQHCPADYWLTDVYLCVVCMHVHWVLGRVAIMQAKSSPRPVTIR